LVANYGNNKYSFHLNNTHVSKWIKLLIAIILLILVLGNLRWNISIDPLAEYSKNFNPCVDPNQNKSHNTSYSNIENLSGNIAFILNSRKIDVHYKQCVLLVYLKIYYCEVRSGQFSSEVRKPLYLISRFTRESSFSKAYCEIVGNEFF
jgi:hypothetical protein